MIARYERAVETAIIRRTSAWFARATSTWSLAWPHWTQVFGEMSGAVSVTFKLSSPAASITTPFWIRL
jgi:hypothetical protein